MYAFPERNNVSAVLRDAVSFLQSMKVLRNCLGKIHSVGAAAKRNGCFKSSI
jgi:hypothetical protein